MGGKHRSRYHAEYYEKHREEIKAASNGRYLSNREEILEQQRIRNLNRTPEQVAADKAYHDNYYEDHKEEFSERERKRYEENAEEIKTRVKQRYAGLPDEERQRLCRVSVLRKFHTTEAWYSAKLEEQGGHCALCSRVLEENGNRLAIDHNHECCPGTGSCGKCLCGLLCRGCNVRLGTLIAILSCGLVLGEGHTGWAAKAVGYMKRYGVKFG